MKKYLLMSCVMLLSLPAYADTAALIESVKKKDISGVEAMLAQGEDINGVNAQGNTALHYAVATNNSDMVKLLLQHNANINIANAKGWSPLAIAEKKNAGEIYEMMEEKKRVDAEAAKAAALKKAKEEAAQKAAAAEKEKAKKAAQARIEAEKAALTQKAPTPEPTAIKSADLAPTPTAPAKEKTVKIPLKENVVINASPLSAKINRGDEEIIYCMQYLSLQGEQKNMGVAAGYFAIEAGVSKERHDVAIAEGKKYFENASADDIKARADECGQYITPKQAAKQNQIIRSLNKSMGY